MSLCNYCLSLLSSSFAGVGSWQHSWLQVLGYKIRSTSVWSNKLILLGSYLCMVKTIQNYFNNLAHITSFRHTSRDSLSKRDTSWHGERDRIGLEFVFYNKVHQNLTNWIGYFILKINLSGDISLKLRFAVIVPNGILKVIYLDYLLH